MAARKAVMLGRMTGRTLSSETGKLNRYKRHRVFATHRCDPRTRVPRGLRPYRRRRSVVTPHSSMKTYCCALWTGSPSRQR
jgi:hypothetical protein